MSVTRDIRKALRPIRRLVNSVHARMLELPYLLRKPPIGSVDWLIRSEAACGGYITSVPRQRVSPRDGSTNEQLAFGGMLGGDRMMHYGYRETYARCLAPFLG